MERKRGCVCNYLRKVVQTVTHSCRASYSDPDLFTLFRIIEPQRTHKKKRTSNPHHVIEPLKIQMHSQQCFWLVLVNIPAQ